MADPSDESSCANKGAEKDKHTIMTTPETTETAEAAVVAEQGAQNAPEQARAKKGASQKKGAPKAAKGAKKAAPKTDAKPAAKKAAPKKSAKPAAKKAAPKKDAAPREGSKKEAILTLLRRKNGATMAEIAKATDWQKHSIRGFISGTLTKKMGLKVESTKNDAGERTYRLIAN